MLIQNTHDELVMQWMFSDERVVWGRNKESPYLCCRRASRLEVSQRPPPMA